MSFLETGLVGTSRKENESRVPIHPRHLDRIAPARRERLVLEAGYGERFGVSDAQLRRQVGRLASREEILAGCDVVVLPKPETQDLAEMKEGGILWGWPHTVQNPEMTQTAIDRRLTLIAFESMFHWRGEQAELHTFYRNNEMAGYCAILHLLELVGRDGYYGPRARVVVLSLGSVSRGAIHALLGRGFADVTVYTQRPPHLVRDQLIQCRFRRMRRAGPAEVQAIAEEPDESTRAMAEVF